MLSIQGLTQTVVVVVVPSHIDNIRKPTWAWEALINRHHSGWTTKAAGKINTGAEFGRVRGAGEDILNATYQLASTSCWASWSIKQVAQVGSWSIEIESRASKRTQRYNSKFSDYNIYITLLWIVWIGEKRNCLVVEFFHWWLNRTSSLTSDFILQLKQSYYWLFYVIDINNLIKVILWFDGCSNISWAN